MKGGRGEAKGAASRRFSVLAELRKTPTTELGERKWRLRGGESGIASSAGLAIHPRCERSYPVAIQPRQARPRCGKPNGYVRAPPRLPHAFAITR